MRLLFRDGTQTEQNQRSGKKPRGARVPKQQRPLGKQLERKGKKPATGKKKRRHVHVSRDGNVTFCDRKPEGAGEEKRENRAEGGALNRGNLLAGWKTIKKRAVSKSETVLRALNPTKPESSIGKKQRK